MTAALLLLADGRFPAGGHAHSGGAAAAVAAGTVTDVPSLERFLLGRLHTVGLTAAGLAAAAARTADPAELAELDRATEARTPSAALRAVSRRLGRQLLRAARAGWPADAGLAALPAGTHHPVVLGTAARAAGLTDRRAAELAVHEAVSGPATAALRLLGLDPYQLVAVLARLAPQLDLVAERAATATRLPAASAPLLDLYGERYDSWKVKLFAS
ncbi:urease accessory protein UreF [Streptomyces tateyamensis]|uniref:Urease accessory protein UreF n=2 Tax=Streptomyces tateyamensis TaxID=565073 RepID=A0A2V4NHN9_9ACTN|nr:urease accessory protein UreF [Streptomyces tateyamensis]